MTTNDNIEQETNASSHFETLIREHAKSIGAAVRKVCAQRYAALIPDVEQEIRLALWRQLEAGKKIRSPGSYLYKVALTTALAAIKRQHPTLERPLSLEPVDNEATTVATTTAPGSQSLSVPERAQLLKQCLALVSDDQARALRAYLAGFNHQEVASLFGWSESAARHNIYRGMDALKKQFASETQ